VKIDSETLQVRKLPHVKLAYATTNLGTIDIYAVAKCDTDTINSEDFRKQIFNAFLELLNDQKILSRQFLQVKHVSSSNPPYNCINGQVLTADFPRIFSNLGV